MEATGGFEPPNRGFADPRLNLLATSPWSGRRDSNPRPSPWQGDVLPLNYFRFFRAAPYVKNAPYLSVIGEAISFPLTSKCRKSAEEEI